MNEGAVRPGEELDAAAVDAWLKAHVADLRGEPRITQYAGGASNWTYRLRYDSHDLVLRRPPKGTKARSAHDMGREYRLQKALKPFYPYVPQVIAHCEDESVIGAEFYVMERIDGIIPRKELGFELDPEMTRTLCMNVLDTLIALHRVDYLAAGLENLAKGAGYIERQVSGWIQRYYNARTWNVPRGTKIMRWLEGNMPSVERICVTHNDFRFDNVVLHPERPIRVIGVLDWELATLGDPLMDLGNALAYWVQADDDFFGRATRRQPTHLPGMLTRKEVVSYYCAQMGFDMQDWRFYETFGLFRLSVIVQQIYYRYFNYQTRNPAFKNFWLLVNYLHWRARRAMR